MEGRFAKLQNGSDVRGVALAGVPDEPVTLTPNAAFCLARAFAARRAGEGGQPVRVAVGRDPRKSGPDLARAALMGVASVPNATALDAGLATTPAMYMSTQFSDVNADGAFMITASHLPWNRNGMKFFMRHGGASKADIKELLADAARVAVDLGLDVDACFGAEAKLLDWDTTGDAAPEAVPLLARYAEHCQGVVRRAATNRFEALAGEGAALPPHLTGDAPLAGLRITVDAGNGCGGFLATDVLAPLGADVSGSRFLEPDGDFPNHIPNPEVPEAMASAVDMTTSTSSHMGICLDTDCDRSAVVARSGAALNRNRLIAAMSSVVLSAHPGTSVVTDSVTSNGLRDFIEARGGRHVRYMRGYKNVIDKGIELGAGSCQLMMETSGHGALAENFYLDDGLFMALLLAGEVAARAAVEGGGDMLDASFDPLGDLVADLREPAESREFRIKIDAGGGDFKPLGEAAIASFRALCESRAELGWTLEAENHEGWRVRIDEGNGKEGWALLRMSLHDPLCVLNVESDVAGGVEPIVAVIRGWCSVDAPALDSSSLV